MAGRGSAKGERRGGRKKGTPNKRTVAREERIQRAIDKGQSPLEFMLSVARGEVKDIVYVDGKPVKVECPLSVRLEAARSAAPYTHKRLAQSVDLGSAPVSISVNLGADE